MSTEAADRETPLDDSADDIELVGRSPKKTKKETIKTTPGGVKIIDLTKVPVVDTPRKAKKETDLMKEIVLGDFKRLKKDTKDLLAIGVGYKKVANTSVDEEELAENGVKGPNIFNPLATVYQVIAEKDEE